MDDFQHRPESSLMPNWDLGVFAGTARKSFRSLKRQWNRANNVNAALRAEINSRNHRRSQRRVHKSEQIFRVLERYADKYKLNLAVLRDLLHQDYLSDEVSCPEDEMHETKEAWKFRMADLEAHRPSQTVQNEITMGRILNIESPPPVVRPRSAESSPPPSIRRRSNPTIDLMRSVSPVEIRRPTFRTPAASADSVRQNLSGYSPALSGSCGCSELDYTLLDAFWGRVIFRNQPQLTTTSAPRPSFSIRCLDLTALLPYLACWRSLSVKKKKKKRKKTVKEPDVRTETIQQLVHQALSPSDGRETTELDHFSAKLETRNISGRGQCTSRECGGVDVDLARILSLIEVTYVAGSLQVKKSGAVKNLLGVWEGCSGTYILIVQDGAGDLSAFGIGEGHGGT
ncbi:hypothetical protein B0H13DRAFT_1910436 [Mycena leptocephala]|nr:hypothetical protein B0H13DRAFT_1910436 [Mycena leptocephala]